MFVHPAAELPALLPRLASVLETSREHPVVLCVLTFWHSNHGEEKKKKTWCKPELCRTQSGTNPHSGRLQTFYLHNREFGRSALSPVISWEALCRSHDVLFDSTIPEWRFGITQALCASKFTAARPPACPPVGPLKPPPNSFPPPPALHRRAHAVWLMTHQHGHSGDTSRLITATVIWSNSSITKSLGLAGLIYTLSPCEDMIWKQLMPPCPRGDSHVLCPMSPFLSFSLSFSCSCFLHESIFTCDVLSQLLELFWAVDKERNGTLSIPSCPSLASRMYTSMQGRPTCRTKGRLIH